ncbi:hypothetical protein LSAT2_017046 [Lamellibrachia satsuma]|nr:hypothetical protein LSAT2_017046 [Lamellibrachia satsuma]
MSLLRPVNRPRKRISQTEHCGFAELDANRLRHASLRSCIAGASVERSVLVHPSTSTGGRRLFTTGPFQRSGSTCGDYGESRPPNTAAAAAAAAVAAVAAATTCLLRKTTSYDTPCGCNDAGRSSAWID